MPPRSTTIGSTTQRLQALAQRAPEDRDRVVDLLRLGSILLVVLGHWLVAVVLLDDGELVVTQAIARVPETRPLTWLFQVMPVFFAVGGYVNRGSWERARRDGRGAAPWIRDRARRLLVPAVPVLATWSLLVVAGGAIGVDGELLAEGARGALLPIWFLAVYLAVIALTPWTVRLHERYGLRVVAVVTLVVVAGDVATRAGLEVVGGINYLAVWGGAHQLGYLWADRRPRSGPAVGVAAGAWAAAVSLILVAGYPGSMVAVDGVARQNTDPPSLALWLFAVGQLALLVALHPLLRRWIADDRRYGAVAAGGGSILTVFLWHMTAVVVVATALVPTGVWPPADGGIDASWWAWRPVWVAVCLVVLAGLWALAHPAERAGTLRTAPARWRIAVGVPLAVAGLAWIMAGGLAGQDGTLAVWPLALTVAGMWALQVLTRARSSTADG